MPPSEQRDRAPAPADQVISLDHLSPPDGPVVGAKAFNLGRLRQAGLPVPPGFCVTTAAYHEWLAQAADVCERLQRLERSVAEDQHAIDVQAAALRQALAEVPVPGNVREAIRQACAQSDTASWAVRSSATTEDQPEGSFAGQHDSFLDVAGLDQVVESVRRCWVSLFTERAILYRARRHLDGNAVAMAVVVQEMVNAEAAGVLFSGDPVRRDAQRIIIEGTRGCGHAVVSGHVTPERVVLDRASLNVVEQIVPDGLGLAALPAGAAPHRPPGVPLLDDDLVRRLAALALQAERLFGGPQDLEWAVCGRTLYVLQARPITTRVQPTPGPPEVWCNANVCENLPGVLTPMSWSLVKLLLAGCFRPILRLIGINTDVRPWFGRIAGRAYLNAGLSDEVLRRVHLAEQVSVWELLGGRPTEAETAALEAVRRRARRLSWRGNLALLFLALRAVPGTSEQSGRVFLQRLRQRMDGLARTPFSALSDAELAAFIPGIVPRLFPELDHPPALVRVFACLGPGLACALALRRVTRRWLQDTQGRIAQRLLGGAGDMASAMAAQDLWRLGEWARGRAAVAKVLETTSSLAEVQSVLQAIPDGAVFLGRWDEFIRRHGHHARGELDAFNPRWLETPDELLDMVRHYLRLPGGFNPIREQAQRRAERDALLEDCRRRLRNPLKRWLVTYLAKRGQRGLAFRENVKSEAVRSVGLLRAALLEGGRRLESRGLLRRGEDVFFLEIEDLERALRGQPVGGLTDTVIVRQAERARLETVHPPPIVVGDFLPGAQPAPPDSRTDRELRGLGVSPGIATGRARVVSAGEAGARVMPGEILVAPHTDPGWTPLFLTAAGIVADVGGQLSHGSIIAREYGIPAVVNVGHATQTIRTGQVIEVDGDLGVVRVLST